jgi:APA family basic amino acid/polyamine antiporter
MVLSAATIFILRKKTKHLDDTGIYKMKLFPLMPILFIAAYVFVGISISLDYKPTDILAKFGIANAATIGLAVMGGFIGLYFLLRKLTNTHK